MNTKQKWQVLVAIVISLMLGVAPLLAEEPIDNTEYPYCCQENLSSGGRGRSSRYDSGKIETLDGEVISVNANPSRIGNWQGKHLNQVLREMNPESVIETISRSGLRGRGGAGYPTGLKWATVAKAQNEHKYIICNADEGDPGAFMDRSVLESDPHRVIDGMALAAIRIHGV